MKFLKILSAIVVASFLSMSFGAVAHADEKHGSIELMDAWARARTAMAKVGGAYVTVHNLGSEEDRLIGAKSTIAHKTEIHTTKMTNGVMKMVPVRDGIVIKAGSMLMLKPGSYHIMFMGLKEPILKGKTFPVTLVFEKAGEIETTVIVNDAGAMGKMDHSKMKKAN
ncbi:MAG: copper chaperone PCu(A)C [Sneathiella sp.]|nr:copper chaperone PCu(A)C [Sneathiella sp.]